MANKTIVAWDMDRIPYGLHDSIDKLLPGTKSRKIYAHKKNQKMESDKPDKSLLFSVYRWSGGVSTQPIQKLQRGIKNQLNSKTNFVIISNHPAFSETVIELISLKKHVTLIHDGKADELMDGIYSRCLGRDIQRYLRVETVKTPKKTNTTTPARRTKKKAAQPKRREKHGGKAKPVNSTIVAWDIENIPFRIHKPLKKVFPKIQKSDKFFVHNSRHKPLTDANSNYLLENGWTRHLVKPGKDSADKKIADTLKGMVDEYNKFVIITGDYGFSEIVHFLISKRKDVVLIHNDKSDKLLNTIYSRCLGKDIDRYLVMKNIDSMGK